VYIDVWATWCGPCRMEIPYYEKLKDKYKNKNIHFLSISVDENTEGWKKFIKEKSMKGNQFIAIGNFDSDIARGYNIRGIPRFILIDKEGKILDANAPRPSSNEIHKVLAGLL
jgi:thiol-disulfide isomerase/thioredoxin